MKKLFILLVVIALISFIMIGCKTAETDKKIISTDGSTSMEKLIGYLGEAYAMENTNIKLTYNPTGSGSGILSVSEDRCDIGLSSRELKPDEAKNLLATTVAIDSIAIIVNNNNPVADLSMQELASLYKGELTNWKELGGKPSSVVLIGREAASGTRDGFESVTATKDQCKYFQELTSAGDVIQTVSSNPNAIGYTSLSSVKDSVKVVSIEGILPTEKTIKNGQYKLNRNFIFVTRKNNRLTDTVKNFLDYALSERAAYYIRKSGFIPVLE